MSSILDALRKVEAEERRRPIRLPPARPRSRGRLAALVAAAAFVAGAGVVALVVGLRSSAPPEPPVEAGAEVASAAPVEAPPSPPAPVAAAPPTAVPPAAAPLAAAPSAPSAAPLPAAPATPFPSVPAASVPAASVPAASVPAVPEPRPPVVSGGPTEVQGPVAQAPADDAGDEVAADSDVPEQITILRPSHEAAPAPQAEVQVEALPAPAPPEPMIDVLPGPPAGAPDIHVSFLIYSAVPARRQVSLTIDNGPLLTLQEGQKAGSVSLVRILRDRIHVEHGGRTFSVRAVL